MMVALKKLGTHLAWVGDAARIRKVCAVVHDGDPGKRIWVCAQLENCPRHGAPDLRVARAS